MSLDPTLSPAWERARELVAIAELGRLDEPAQQEVALTWSSIVEGLAPAPANSPWSAEPFAEVGSFLNRYAGSPDTPEWASDFLGLAEWVLQRTLYQDPWGGPLNGQQRRQELFVELERRCGFAVVVETGTFRGSTTEWFAALAPRPVVSIETSPRFHRFAQQRLALLPSVRLVRGDSRQQLARLAAQPDFPLENALFYLDAHWGGNFPIGDELESIGRHWRRSIVVIDDFRVPDDPGYGWDDYGEAGRLSADCVSFAQIAPVDLFCPAARSEDETGVRRGCIVAAMAGALPNLRDFSSLRFSPQV